jgi:hypothetical protein
MQKVEKIIFINLAQFHGHVLIPFDSINKEFKGDLKDKQITDEKGKVIGSVVKNYYNCGIAIVNKEILNENTTGIKFNIGEFNTIIYDPTSLWENIKNLEPIEEKHSK